MDMEDVKDWAARTNNGGNPNDMVIVDEEAPVEGSPEEEEAELDLHECAADLLKKADALRAISVEGHDLDAVATQLEEASEAVEAAAVAQDEAAELAAEEEEEKKEAAAGGA